MRPSFFTRLPRLLLGTAHDANFPERLSLRQINLDVLSGLTVSLALVPEAIAFAFVAGVAPLVGLYAAFIVGLITAVIGGWPGMISGATGALAVVMVAVVVGVGVIMSALVYAWNAAKRIDASTRPSVREAGALVYDIQGPLFFGSIASFHELFDIKNDPEKVIIDFSASRVVDQSALQAIEDIAAKYDAAGKTLLLRHLTRDCHRLLSKSGQLFSIVTMTQIMASRWIMA